MPEYLSPGVYVEEIEIGGKPIEGVSTSTAGFLGQTERGPVAPQLITGFGEYQRIYGELTWNAPGEKKSEAEVKAAADAAKKAEADVAKKEEAARNAPPEKKADAEKAAADARKQATVAAEAAAKAQGGDGKPVPSFLPYGVEGFFANGGKRCYVARICGEKAAPAAIPLGESVVAEAIGPGAWGNWIEVEISKAKADLPTDPFDPDWFRLVVRYWRGGKPAAADASPAAFEEFDPLSRQESSQDYWVKKVNEHSNFIRLRVDAAATDALAVTAGKSLTGGNDGKPLALADYQGDDEAPKGKKSGLAAMAELDDVSIVCVPDEEKVNGLTGEIVTHCERLKDRIAVLQSKEGDVSSIPSLRAPRDSKYAAIYFPWIQVTNPVNGMPKLIPPGGHVAGIYARSDTERGVHKAPANETVRGANDLQSIVTTGVQDVLNPRGINCIRSFNGRGIRVWGARTASSDPLWKYVNIRRLFIFLEKSIERSTQWVVFEPNNEHLWARVRQSVSDFLTQVWKDGALMGLTPEEAFFVRCDRTTMTDNDIENGRLIVVIGVAPARPAEFVIFRLAQWRSGSSITE